MKKRALALFVSLVLMLSVCTAVFAENEAIRTYTLSLEDAISLKLEKDPSFLNADVKIKDAERQLAQAKTNQKDMQGVAVRISSGISGLALQRGYYVRQAEIGVQSALLEKQQAIADASYAVTQQYYNVKLTERLLSSAENAYDMALNNKNTMDTQFSIGMVSELDVNNARYALNQAKAARDRYMRSLELARKSFAAAVFIEEDNFILNLTDDIEYIEFDSDLAEDTQKVDESRYDIFMLKASVELAKHMEATSLLFGATSSEYSSAHQARVQSETTYNNTSKLIRISVNSTYNSILDAKDSIALAEENLALRKQEYNAAVVQNELGLITNTQLTAAMNNIVSAEIELENAKLTYKLAVEKYGYEISIGLSQ